MNLKKKLCTRGTIDKYKTRWVVIGYSQKKDRYVDQGQEDKLCKLRKSLYDLELFLNNDMKITLYTKSIESISQIEYAKIIESIIFFMNCTKFDMSRLSRYTHNPSSEHWAALRHLLRYVFTLSGGAILWKIFRHICIARSTMESKSTSKIVKELFVSLCCDSQAPIGIAMNKRYIHIRQNSVKELLKINVISLELVRSKRKLANPFTRGPTRKEIKKRNQGNLGLSL
ncbi:hypothetical protein CR513_35167, partial [Mucuna pruriens]